MNYLIYLILFSIIIIYLYTHISIRSNTNSNQFVKHHTNEYEFAHFSPITEANKWFFPTYAFTSPLYFTISEGEAFIIPKGYWHWIKSEPKTIAVSFWNKTSSEEQPRIIKMSSPGLKEIILKNISNEKEIKVWDSALDKNVGKSSGCVITLPGYVDNMNENLLSSTLPQIKYPSDLGWNKDNSNVNLWIALGKHDTGLHCDDYDGVLEVLQGSKTIRLFHPSQSNLLLPYPVIPEWAKGKAECVSYNKYKSFGNVKGWPSARLLYESISNKKVLLEVSKHTTQSYVWGCKWQDGIMRWELYKYFYDRFTSTMVNKESSLIIESFDLFDRENPIGDTQHFYYANQIFDFTLPFYGRGTQKKIESSEEIEESIFIYDTTESWKLHYFKYIQDLKFSSYASTCICLLEKYACNEMCVWNKGSNTIFIQYLGISVNDFVEFLNTFNYPNSFVRHVTENTDKYENIPHEITIVYDITTKTPIRSGFYGIVGGPEIIS